MTLTAAEQKTLDDIAAAQARGEDPFGDNDDTGATTTTTEDTTKTGEAAPGEGDGAASGEGATGEGEGGTANDQLDEAALAAIANDDLPIGDDPLQFNAQVPTDYKTARAALLAEKAEAMAKLMDGELDAKEYAAIETRVMDSLEDLSAQRIRAETLLEANAQTAAKSQGAVIQALIVRAENEVPYATETKAQKQFDMALKLQLDDPDNAGKPFAHAVNEAHKVVLAMRGIQAKPAATTPAAPRKPAGEAPVTLRSIPAAATPNTGGSITDQLARLSGQEYEAAYAKLTPAQRAALLED
jgi:hypothetical protein